MAQQRTPEQAPAAPRPAPLRTRAEQLADVLGASIAGRSPGDPVGTLESLRAETGYAYSTVSEAVRLRRDRGLLEIRPGRGGGLFVADRGPVVRMRHTLLGVGENPTDVADAVELRDHLEILIDTGAARCRTETDLAELRALLAQMSDAPDWGGFLQANWQLHERIAGICPNRMAAAVYTGTLGHLNPTTSRIDETSRSVAYREERLRVHVDLVEAIAAGDVSAVALAVARHNRTT